MTDKQIEIFLRLAENLNFARTAEELYTTQPTITREIKSLEEEVGVLLFNRTKRRVMLTPAGLSLQTDLKEVQTGIRNAIMRAQANDAKFHSQISIGFCHEESVALMYKAMKAYHELYPEIKISLTATSLSKLQQEYNAGNLDIVFGMKGALTPGIHDRFERLFVGCWLAMLPNEHALANRKQLTLADLNGHTILHWNDPKHPVAVLHTFYKDLEKCSPDCSHTYCNNMHEINMLVRAGFGVCTSLNYSVHPDPEYQLIPLVYEGDPAMAHFFDYYAMWHTDRDDVHAETFFRLMQDLYQDEMKYR